MTFKMEGKEIYHIFVFTKYCCVSSIRKVPQACAQQGFASMRTARFRKHAHSKVPQACAQQGSASMRTARFRKHAHSKVPQACAQQGSASMCTARFPKHAHSKQRKANPTQTMQFHVKFMRMPC